MKLVCFPHYTCGGLLCDILNGTHSPIGSNGGIMSIQHSIGKIGDSVDVFEEFDIELLLKKIQKHNSVDWIGTHCWPGKHADLFESIVNITTTTYKSKMYRWTRAYHLYHNKLDNWSSLQGIDHIDKTRETAKNYFEPFKPVTGKNVINLEFADVVESATSFQKLVGHLPAHNMARWKLHNKFLYDADLWQSYTAQRFYEAEYELMHKEFYVYQ